MCPCSAAVSPAIAVLIADSNRMQAQLLTSALRRRSEFRIATCQVDIASILQAVTSSPAKVVVLSLNHSVNIASQMASIFPTRQSLRFFWLSPTTANWW